MLDQNWITQNTFKLVLLRMRNLQLLCLVQPTLNQLLTERTSKWTQIGYSSTCYEYIAKQEFNFFSQSANCFLPSLLLICQSHSQLFSPNKSIFRYFNILIQFILFLLILLIQVLKFCHLLNHTLQLSLFLLQGLVCLIKLHIHGVHLRLLLLNILINLRELTHSPHPFTHRFRCHTYFSNLSRNKLCIRCNFLLHPNLCLLWYG